MTRVRWILIFWIFVLSAVAFLDRVNISIAGLSIAAEYHLSDVQLGRVFSSLLVGYTLFQAPAGWLADRLGSRRVLTLGVVWWGIFTALTASLPANIPFALACFIGVRFLLGAGEAVMYPASNQFTSRWIPTEERGIANGWIFAGVGAGAGITPPLVTWVVLHYGWRASFWVCAVIGVLSGLVWFVIARDSPEEHPSVSAAELAKIRAGLTISEQSLEEKNLRTPWSKILTSPNVWATAASYFSFGYVAWIFFSWFYIYLAKVRGLNLKTSAMYAMLPFLAMALCCLAGGIINDQVTKARGKRAGRCGIAVVAMALAAIFLVLGARAESARFASVILAGGAGALYLAQSSFWAVTADIGGKSSGSVSGVVNMGAQLGGVVTSAVTPLIAIHYGWTAPFLVAAALCGLGAFAWLLVDPGRKIVYEGERSG
ncbi:MAG TPA: MFS transporter [Candidatus Acidoferrum sp.]|nr:MFS transporter [Candidatus Acidoferrum sp.]